MKDDKWMKMDEIIMMMNLWMTMVDEIWMK
jgi:hypothetical protein